MTGQQIFVAPPQLCDHVDVELAHLLCQQHRGCRISQCVWKAAAHHTLVQAGQLVPQSMSPRERAAARGIDYPAEPVTDTQWPSGPAPGTLREILDKLESLTHDTDTPLSSCAVSR